MFTYDGAGNRKKMQLNNKGISQLQRYYLGDRYEVDYSSSANKQILYVGGDAYSAPAVYINQGSSWALYYICRDYLESITHLTNSSGTVTQENSYDAWGRLRNPATQVAYAPNEEPALLLGRGYTGHEHLTQFGLINMNARLYDPAAGRFLSPDPFVQMPDFSQNFNRYSYAMNNPFAYVDEDGEFVLLAVGIAAGIGAVVNVATHWKDIKSVGGWKGFWKGAGYFAVGGVAGGAGAAAGIAAAVGFGGMMGATAAGVASASMGGTAGAAVGAAAGATSGFILNTSNSLLEGERIGGALQSGVMGGLTGGLIGGVTGGIAGGVKALQNGRDFWTGKYTNQGLVQQAANRAEQAVGEAGRFAGTKKHEYATTLLEKYQNIHEDRLLKFKVPFNDTDKKLRGILDVLDNKNKIIYDFKFGYPNMSPDKFYNTPQMIKYRNYWKIPTQVIKPKF